MGATTGGGGVTVGVPSARGRRDGVTVVHIRMKEHVSRPDLRRGKDFLRCGRSRVPATARRQRWHDGRVPVEAHLQMIQSVISRLSAQSITVKGWSVTVTAALLGFGASSTTASVALVA